MKKNMGGLDRIIRLLIAAGILVLYFTDVISGILAIVLLILAVIFALTSMMGVCPLYMPFKLKTTKTKEA